MLKEISDVWHYGAIPTKEVAALVIVTACVWFLLGIVFAKFGIAYGWVVPLAVT